MIKVFHVNKAVLNIDIKMCMTEDGVCLEGQKVDGQGHKNLH